jgi:Putative transposase
VLRRRGLLDERAAEDRSNEAPVRSGNREGLERLCRSFARPPFSLERLSILADGRVAYLLRKPRRNGVMHLVMTAVQLLARLSSLIPPPRFP